MKIVSNTIIRMAMIVHVLANDQTSRMVRPTLRLAPICLSLPDIAPFMDRNGGLSDCISVQKD